MAETSQLIAIEIGQLRAQREQYATAPISSFGGLPAGVTAEQERQRLVSGYDEQIRRAEERLRNAQAFERSPGYAEVQRGAAEEQQALEDEREANLQRQREQDIAEAKEARAKTVAPEELMTRAPIEDLERAGVTQSYARPSDLERTRRVEANFQPIAYGEVSPAAAHIQPGEAGQAVIATSYTPLPLADNEDFNISTAQGPGYVPTVYYTGGGKGGTFSEIPLTNQEARFQLRAILEDGDGPALYAKLVAGGVFYGFGRTAVEGSAAFVKDFPGSLVEGVRTLPEFVETRGRAIININREPFAGGYAIGEVAFVELSSRAVIAPATKIAFKTTARAAQAGRAGAQELLLTVKDVKQSFEYSLESGKPGLSFEKQPTRLRSTINAREAPPFSGLKFLSFADETTTTPKPKRVFARDVSFQRTPPERVEASAKKPGGEVEFLRLAEPKEAAFKPSPVGSVKYVELASSEAPQVKVRTAKVEATRLPSEQSVKIGAGLARVTETAGLKQPVLNILNNLRKEVRATGIARATKPFAYEASTTEVASGSEVLKQVKRTTAVTAARGASRAGTSLRVVLRTSVVPQVREAKVTPLQRGVILPAQREGLPKTLRAQQEEFNDLYEGVRAGAYSSSEFQDIVQSKRRPLKTLDFKAGDVTQEVRRLIETTRGVTVFKERLGEKAAEKEKQEELSRIALRTREVVREKVAEKTRVTQRPRTDIISRTTLRPRFDFPQVARQRQFAASAAARLFEVLVRRGGKFKVVSEVPLPFGKAVAFGARVVQNTLAATFKLRAAGFGAVEEAREPTLLGFKIRGENYIQLPRFRLGTLGEKFEIQAARRFRRRS